MAVKLNESQIKYLGINKKNDTTTYVLDINGATYTNGRIYSDEWIQFNDAAKGIYWANGNSTNLYPNNVGSYGSLILIGDRGGYNGILLGNSKDYMAVMSGATHQGLFNESNSKWIVYYNKSTGRIGIGTSDLKEYNNTLHGSTYLNGTTYINGATTVNSTLQINNVITMTQASNQALGIDTSLKIGTAKKDLHFNITNGNGSGINDGNAGGITFGYSNNAVAGIYYQTSGSYGTRLIFGTTNSYAAGAFARMIIQNNGYVGINTLTPSYHLHVNGDVMANNFRGYLEGNARTLKDHGQHTETASGTTGNSPTTGLLYTSGLFMTRTYNDTNTPISYGNIINVAGAGSGQLLLEWSGNDNTPGHLYYRSHRDTSTGGWSSWITILDNNNYATHLNGTYVNVTGDTMTGLLTLWTGASHSGIKLANTYVTAISGEVIFQNNSAIRFGGDGWDYNVWAGLKYNPNNKYIYLGLADGSIFTANSAQSGGRILTPGISYLHIGNQTTYYIADSGAINASTVYTNDWFRSYNATGWYNQTYAGGWYMTDTTYVRSYNNKALLVGNNIYVGTTAGAGTGLSLHGTSSPATYGIHMSTTANHGKHGDVQSDWATYFHMNAVGQRGWVYRAGTTNVASISANGIGTFAGITQPTVQILAPTGGNFTSQASTQTGYLKITLPVSWTSAMIRFKVDIYDYRTHNTVTYTIGGYNYGEGRWVNTAAYCDAPWTYTFSNLPVYFGHDGSKCAIYIGASNTSWSYPQVMIRDVLIGFGQYSQIATWSKNWSVSFTTSLGTTSGTTVNNSNVGYSVNHANQTTLLALHNTITSSTTRSVATSAWNGSISGVTYMWGQSFKDSSIGSDTGDLVLAVRAGQYTSGGTELCMAIDGDYYSMGNKVLHAGNYSSYALPKAGGTMNASAVIKFPATAGSIATSDPMSITYGRIAAYGTLCINANTDNSGTEYVILTAGKGHSSSTADGLAVGTSTLTWLGNTVMTVAGNTMNNSAAIRRRYTSVSWVQGRSGALLANSYDASNRFSSNAYNPLWSAKSINGSWDCGTYTASNNLYFTYITDANFDANNNATTHQIYINGDNGRIYGNLEGAAKYLGRSGDPGVPMIFNWSGQSGQPSWLWGGSDGTNMYVYNPSNFSVNYANSSGYTTRWDITASNPTTTSTDNCTNYFNKAGSHIYWYSTTGLINNQPSQWGYILDIGNNSERHQIWMTQSSGSLYHRGGNGSGWASNWQTIFDTSNYTSWVIPKSGGTFTGKVAINYAHTGGGMFQLMSTSSNEASIDYAAGGTSYWVVGKGCGGTGNGTFAWWYNPSAKNVATLTSAGAFTATSVYGAVWNDYAEYRDQTEELKPGHVAYCGNDGKLKLTTSRMQKFEGVVSDTFGFAIGETDEAKTPLAVSGRVLVYTYEDRNTFNSGDCVCAGPNGRVCKMTREEIAYYPDRIVGIVSEIPEYNTWGTGNVDVDERIWIKVK